MTKVFPRDFSYAIMRAWTKDCREGKEIRDVCFEIRDTAKWLSHFYLFVYISQSASDIKP